MSEAQVIHADLMNGCGHDHNEMPPMEAISTLLSGGHPFYSCMAFTHAFDEFHAWHNKTFSTNNESCDLEQIQLRQVKHKQWERQIKGFAVCDQGADEEF